MKIYQKNELEQLANILKQDGVICAPTDTVYGICARIRSDKAYNKLVKMKNRPSQKSFPIMCSNIEQIKELAIVDETAEKIIRAFMPGPVTIILLKKKELINTINNRGLQETDEVAFRLAPTKELYELIECVGSPLFMTSANHSGEPVYETIDEISKKLPDLDGILEGSVSYGISSTMIDCTTKTIGIQREGPISLEEIMKVMKS